MAARQSKKSFITSIFHPFGTDENKQENKQEFTVIEVEYYGKRL